MKAFDFAIVKFTIVFIIGIIISNTIELSIISLITISSIVYILFYIAYFLYVKKIPKTILFGCITYLAILWMGMGLLNISKHPNLENNHYLNQRLSNDGSQLIIIKISKRLKSTLYHHRYEGDILSIDTSKVTGKIILQFPPADLYNSIKSDIVVGLYCKMTPIKPPLNPGAFNYKEYLAKGSIYHQLLIDESNIIFMKPGASTLFGIASNFRQKLIDRLKHSSLNEEELAITQAILLGYRDDIDRSLYTDYINSGAVHILAVSGLHIGLLVLMLQRILSPLKVVTYGNYVRPIIIVGIIWAYAFIAGLSPSICRAVTMFSAVTISLNFKRANNIYNTLATSAFVLLLWNPLFLFTISFQLSYVAVISIVTIQPILYKLTSFKWFLFDKTWQLITVTLSAQIGVAPLSLYYFHQFPGLFMVSSLLLIPGLGLILSLGFIVIILTWINHPIESIISVYAKLISSMNGIIGWVASKEQFIFKEVSFNLLDVLCSYLVIVLIIACVYLKYSHRIIVSLLAVLLIQSTQLINTITINSRSELIIFNKTGATIIGQKSNQTLRLYTSMNIDSVLKLGPIQDYKTTYNIKSCSAFSLKSAYLYYQNSLFIIDSTGIIGNRPFRPDYLLLTNSPKINLSRIIDSLRPGLIISDGSNFKSFVQRWKETSLHKKTPFHDTSEKGAYIIKGR